MTDKVWSRLHQGLKQGPRKAIIIFHFLLEVIVKRDQLTRLWGGLPWHKTQAYSTMCPLVLSSQVLLISIHYSLQHNHCNGASAWHASWSPLFTAQASD